MTTNKRFEKIKEYVFNELAYDQELILIQGLLDKYGPVHLPKYANGNKTIYNHFKDKKLTYLNIGGANIILSKYT